MTQLRPEDLKEGDRVQVTFEGTWHERRGLLGAHLSFDKVGIMNDTYLREGASTITRLPPKGRPLEVGEAVTWQEATNTMHLTHPPRRVYEDRTGTVRFIENGYAVLMPPPTPAGCYPYSGPPIVRPINSISRPCGTPITVEGE